MRVGLEVVCMRTKASKTKMKDRKNEPETPERRSGNTTKERNKETLNHTPPTLIPTSLPLLPAHPLPDSHQRPPQLIRALPELARPPERVRLLCEDDICRTGPQEEVDERLVLDDLLVEGFFYLCGWSS